MGFYISHWSSYITGKLHFCPFDVVEMQWTCVLIYFVTYLYGPGIWSWSFFGMSYVKLRFIAIYLPVFILFLRLFRDITRRIVKGGSGSNGSTVADTSVLCPITPLFLLTTLVIFIYAHNDSSISLMDKYPVLFCMTFGLNYCKISNKLIICQNLNLK